jgi:hypothetical protein
MQGCAQYRALQGLEDAAAIVTLAEVGARAPPLEDDVAVLNDDRGPVVAAGGAQPAVEAFEPPGRDAQKGRISGHGPIRARKQLGGARDCDEKQRGANDAGHRAGLTAATTISRVR